MITDNETLKSRFMERQTKSAWAVHLIKECIDMVETITEDTDRNKTVQEFIPTLSKYDVFDEDLDQIKQILNEFTSNQMTRNETLAYLNHLHDITYYKASNMLLIKEIFKCYF